VKTKKIGLHSRSCSRVSFFDDGASVFDDVFIG